MRCVLLILLSGIILSSTTLADDTVIYESLPDVSIGRVFFSPEQRQRLDKHRHRQVTTGGARDLAPAARKHGNDDAAGYILSSSGKSQIYENGGFVAAKVHTTMRFPGDVNIIRQEQEAHTATTKPQATSESSDEED